MDPEREPSVAVITPARSIVAPIQASIEDAAHAVLVSLPAPERLSAEERRGIIARYTAVLEGNFIYWMTAAYLAVATDEAHAIIEENLREEVRDNHPGMLRKFALAADALPREDDAVAVNRGLQAVRLFVGRASSVKVISMMAFFEGFIMRFMPYLAELAMQRGSRELEYTDVHGVVDVGHTQGLFRALESEMARLPEPRPTAAQLAEGVDLLRALLTTIVHNGHAA